jgi:hypothetical protein
MLLHLTPPSNKAQPHSPISTQPNSSRVFWILDLFMSLYGVHCGALPSRGRRLRFISRSLAVPLLLVLLLGGERSRSDGSKNRSGRSGEEVVQVRSEEEVVQVGYLQTGLVKCRPATCCACEFRAGPALEGGYLQVSGDCGVVTVEWRDRRECSQGLLVAAVVCGWRLSVGAPGGY